MTGRVNEKGAMLNHHHLGDAADEESSEGADPAIPGCAQQHGQGETNKKSDGMDVLMLPHDQPIFLDRPRYRRAAGVEA